MFDTGVDNINIHLKNIFESNELDKDSTIEFFSIVQKEGKRNVKRNAKIYNLDVVIAVGYRVNSKKATKFRIWGTKVLKEYITKSFIIDKERMKNDLKFGKDYYYELLKFRKKVLKILVQYLIKKQ